jgi:hypothetical protein
VGVVNLVLLVVGMVLAAVGYRRARGPYRRYQALRAEDDNIRRYESWRGGLRDQGAGPTGASVMLAMLRRQAQIGGLIVIAGAVCMFLAFFLP